MRDLNGRHKTAEHELKRLQLKIFTERWWVWMYGGFSRLYYVDFVVFLADFEPLPASYTTFPFLYSVMFVYIEWRFSFLLKLFIFLTICFFRRNLFFFFWWNIIVLCKLYGKNLFQVVLRRFIFFFQTRFKFFFIIKGMKKIQYVCVCVLIHIDTFRANCSRIFNFLTSSVEMFVVLIEF